MKKFIKRFFFGFTISCVIVSCVMFSSSAASADFSTYGDVTSTTSNIVNLLSLRTDEQLRKDYIALRNSQNEYVLVLADEFTVTGSNISCGECDVIGYNQDYGTNNNTRYYSVSYDDCSITKNHVVVSNFLEGSSRPDNTNFHDFIICAVVIIIALLIFKVIRGFK